MNVAATIYFFLGAALMPVWAMASEESLRALSAQADEKPVTVDAKQVALDEILLTMSRQTGMAFGYQEGVIDKNRKFSLQVTGTSLREALETLFSDSPYDYKYSGRRILIVQRETQQTVREEGRTVHGVVRDLQGNPLAGATVLLKGTTLGIATDVNGAYRLLVPQAKQTLVFSLVGMKTREIVYEGDADLIVVLE